MFCKHCGSEIDDKAVICVKCGVPVENATLPQQTTEDVPNHLVFAILVTLFCCMPFGIPAIIFSSQVNTKLAKGDVEGAKDSSKKAKTWCIVALCCGAAGGLIYFILAMIGVLAEV
jgi:hypothetical protein